jgi:zinc and cadmium transporter
MPLLAWIVLFTALGGALSAVAASAFLLAPGVVRQRAVPHLVSFATGALLGAALLGLLPHAVQAVGAEAIHAIALTMLVGLLVFFVLEKLVLWRHCHHETCDGHVHEAHASANGRDAASAWLILIGDGFHNVIDGVLIAAAFMTDVHLGVVTAIAVFAHEIPQEVGDLAILLHGGMSRAKALTLNLLTSLSSVAGGIAAYFALAPLEELLPYAVALAASSFLYIAVADLIPGLHRRIDPASALKQLIFILAGVAVILASHPLAH